MMAGKSERIQLIDAVRGFCIVLMIAYHCGYDLVAYGLIPVGVLYNPLLDFLEPFFAGVFILLSGVSSRFSRSNVKRGLKTLAAALLVTIATYFAGSIIVFGILHFLGCAMIIYGLCRKLIDRAPQKPAPFIYFTLFFIFHIALSRTFDVKYLWWLGFANPDFISYDYFPILPWIFIFFLGTWLGRIIVDRRFPDWFYKTDIPVLPAIGRNSLLIYLLHQPVLTGIVLLITKML